MIEIARYSLRLRRPLRFAGRVLERREGFFVRVAGGAVGEVAPMPGVHREGVDDCLDVLARLGPAAERDGPPALAFGLSCVRAIAEGDPLVCRPLRPTVGVNALFAGTRDEALLWLREGRFAGCRAVKAKASGGDDAETLRTLAEGLPPSTRLRIDCNRSLGFDEAVALLAAIPQARVEYVEEPLADPLRIPELHHATGHAMALDESLVEPELRSALETAPGVVAHVLKPSLHGSLASARARAERTARQGLCTTLSNALETSYTLRLLARVATWLPGADRDHGLGSGGMLLDEPCDPLLIVEGRTSTEAPLAPPRLDFTRL